MGCWWTLWGSPHLPRAWGTRGIWGAPKGPVSAGRSRCARGSLPASQTALYLPRHAGPPALCQPPLINHRLGLLAAYLLL